MAIRVATEGDVEGMVQMGRHMYAEGTALGGRRYSSRRVAVLMRRLIEDGGCWVATVGGDRWAGAAGAMCTENWFSPDRVVTDFFVYVSPEHRGSMAAVRLLRAMEGWAVDMNASLIRLGITTGVCTEDTAALYRRLGYSDAGILFAKDLKSGQ